MKKPSYSERLRAILRKHGYTLRKGGIGWVAYCADNGVRVTALSPMGIADNLAPIIRDEELTKFCAALD